MFDKIKRLGADTAIYGISTILGRFLNYLLTPFYTNVLVTSEYGVATYLFSLLAFVNVIYNYGMESAFFKFFSTEEAGTKKQSFSMPFYSILCTSAVFTILILACSGPIGGLLHIPGQFQSIVPLTAFILAFDALSIIPFAALRMERRSRTFAFIKLANIIVNVVLNIILLVWMHQGVVGIFISALAASVLAFVLLLPTVKRHLVAEFNGPLLKALLRFGLPFIPAGLATAAIQVIDRPILRALTDDSTVGVYQANYRLGIFMMLVVSMYDYAWRPFYFSIAKDPDARKIFSRVLTYLIVFMAAILLGLSFFMNDLVTIKIFGRSFIHPSYWGGLNIVPIVLLGYVFLGVTTNLSAGIYIEKKTQLMPPITFIGAAVNIGANYLLIPVWGMAGAAWATFFAYFIMAVVLYFVAMKVYPVEYELGRIFKVVLAAGAVFACFYYYHPPAFELLYKTGLCIAFLLLMYAMKFFDQKELAFIMRKAGKRPAQSAASAPTPDEPASGL